MAFNAGGGGRLVEQHALAVDRPGKRVASGTGHVLVGALQGKLRSRVVIELSRLPAIQIVATRALRHVAPGGELCPMGIGMASRALLGCRTKVHVFQVRLQRLRSVTIDTGHSTMCAKKREIGLGMIEAL